jgi:hypothetical protein
LWLVELRGINPITGAEVDKDQCALTALTILMADNSRNQHSTAAAVESFRNEMVNSNNQLLMLANHAAPKD